MTYINSFAALKSRRVLFLYSLIASFCAVLISLAAALPAQAATVTAAAGTITDPDGSGVEGVSVELHNGDQSIRVTTTTDGSGAFVLQADDSEMDGEEMTVEFTAPDGYNEPSNSPYLFDYSIGDSTQEIEFVLVLAPKELTVSVTDENGEGVERFDVYAVPLSGDGTGTNSQVTGSSGTLDLTGGEWAITIDRNLSETDPSRYPWVAIGGAQTVTFAEDETAETETLSFEVIGDSTARLVTAKLVNADGEILVGGSFSGDVTFSGLTRYGVVSTKTKVDGTSGVASLYLLPGIYKIDGYHSTQLENQSYDPTQKYVITRGTTTQDLGTITASENTASITGVASLLGSIKSSSVFSLQNAANVNLVATNTDSGRESTVATDADGNFQFINLGPGNYSITTSDESYITRQSSNVEVGAGEAVTGVEMTVAQTDITISGTVQNSGTAVENARAVVIAEVGGETFSAPIDPDTGAYSLKLYNPGDNTVDLDISTQVGSEIFQTDTETVNIKDKTSVTKNLAVSTNEATISGSITDFAEGGTVTTALGDNAEVIAINQQTGSVEKAIIGDDGSYSMDVAPGNWKLMVDVNDVDATAIAGVASDNNVSVSAGETSSGVSVPVHVGDDATVTGTLQDPDGEAVEEARILITNQPQLEKRADKKAGRSVNPEAIVSVVTETDEDGNFSQTLPDGTYTAFFSDNPEDAADIEPLSKVFTVTSGTVELDTATYRSGGTTVSGKVDTNLEEAQVVFSAKKGSTVTAEVNSNGNYSVDLPAGTYSATVSGVKDNYIAYDEKQVKVKSSDKSLNFKTVQKTDVAVPAAAQASCDADESCVVSNTAGAQVRLAPYAASLTEDITVSLVPKVNISNAGGYDQVGVEYEVDIRDSSGFEIAQLEQPADITLPIDKALYDDAVSKDELTTSFKSEELGMFLNEGVQAIAGEEKMTVKTEHLTPFAVTTADTGVATPKKARKLKAVKRKKKSVTLRWKAPKNTSNVTRYRVQVKERKIKKKSTWKKYNKTKKLNNTYVKRKAKRLERGTTYRFRVRAINTAGKSKWSKWKKFRTKGVAVQ